MLRKLYNWTMGVAAKPNAERWLAAISFAESSFFPIPPDVIAVPMVLANRERAWRLAAICTVSSVLGGLFGYAIGYLLFETLGKQLIAFYGYSHGFDKFHDMYAEYGAWVILIKGFTPIPYKLVTIASGVAHYNLALFTVLSIITRGARFFLIAALLKKYGAPIQVFIEKRLTLVTTGLVLLIVGGFALLKLV
ncbi:MAG: DedA family protein [Sphingomonadales bacterium]|nr:MAG: DedA family protein [Sphingomonadales bacterium]